MTADFKRELLARTVTIIATMYIGMSIPATAQLTSNGQGQCQYTFKVDSPVDCSSIDPKTAESLELIRQDIDRSRLSYVAHNSAVQRQLAQMKADFDLLDVEMDALKTKFAAQQSKNLISVTELDKLKQHFSDLDIMTINIRDNVDRQINFFQKYLASINSSMTSDRVERFRIEAGLQNQIVDKNQLIVGLEQRLSKLESILSTSASTISTPASKATSSSASSATGKATAKIVPPSPTPLASTAIYTAKQFSFTSSGSFVTPSPSPSVSTP